MAQHIYLKFDGIDGACTTEGRRGWIELMNLSESLTTNDGRPDGTCHDVSVARFCDAATPALARAAAENRRLTEGVVDICEEATVLLRMRFEDVVLRAWGLSAAKEGHEAGVYENFSFGSGTIEWIWRPTSPSTVRAACAPARSSLPK